MYAHINSKDRYELSYSADESLSDLGAENCRKAGVM